MVNKCVVYGCKSTWYPGSHITYYAFPKDSVRRSEWWSVVPFKTKAYENARIFSLHFKASDYDHTSKRLKKTAVPFSKDVPSSQCNQI